MGMPAAVQERTVLPPHDPQDMTTLLEALSAPAVSVCGTAGQPMMLPEEVREALYNVVLALSQGKGISLVPRQLKLTTQEAADLLNISRPTLVRLLENGRIPFEKPGRHRRVSLDALLAYQQATRSSRRAALSELSRDALGELQAALAER
jgi:excisionase family DNA binding protein